MEEKMKVKIIAGIVLMTLSSLSVAAQYHRTGTSVNNLSRSPFQADRDKAQAQKSSHLTPQVIAPSEGSGMISSVQQSGSHGPLPMNLQENHLLSLDIDNWARAQGMHLLWNSNRDYLIYSTITLNGDNRDAILDQLGQLFRSENYGLVVKLYEKNNVLVIDGQ